jgi:hypothetical protein
VPEVQEPLLEPAASTAARRSEREHVSDFYNTGLPTSPGAAISFHVDE